MDSKKRKILVFNINAMAFARGRLALSEKLKDIGIDCIFISYSKECKDYLERKGAKVVDIIEHFDRMKLPSNVEELLMQYEDKYNIPSLNLTILGDVNYSWQGRKVAMNDLTKHFIFWEEFLSKNKVDFIVGGMERFINEVPRAVSKKFGVTHYFWRYPPVNEHFLLLKEHMGRWENLDEYWEKNKNRELTKEEREKALVYINSIKTTKERAHLISRKPVINLGELKWFFQRAYANLFVEKMKNPYGRVFLKIAKIRTIRAIRKKMISHLYEQPNLSERYIFYPLHMQEDAQVLVRAPQYIDQVALIQNLSNHLPIGYKLYIKEHPSNLGGMPIKDLKKIKSFPNVKLIDAKSHSHDLIKNAKAMITINSNAGWEGLLYEKPVIVIGASFYEVEGLTYRVRDFYELPKVYKQAVNQKKFDTEKMIRFMSAVQKVIMPGEVVHQEGFVEKFCTEENLKLAVAGFKRVLMEGKSVPDN